MNKIQIREADNSDISLLTRIIKESFQDVAEKFNLTPENCPKHPSNCTEEWVKNDFARGVRYFILEKNNTPAGCVALENPDTDHCYLERLAVLPDQRKNGFGKMLVDYIIELANVLEVKEINIGIISEQLELKSWYKKTGFIESGQKQFSHLPFIVAFMSYKL